MSPSSSYPSVSVVIPTYNRPSQTLEAIRSVIGQTFKDFELIVIDDGSACPGAQLEEFSKRVSFKYLKTTNQGVAAARNIGVSNSSGRWIAFLDSDDRWLPQKLEAQMQYLAVNPECRILQTREIWYRRGEFVNPREKHQMSSGDLFSKSLELCVISPSAVLMEKSLFLEVGQFDEKMLVCEDYDLWLRITKCHCVGLVDKALVEKYGGLPDQLSCSQVAMDRFRVYSLAKLFAPEYKLTEEQLGRVKSAIRQKLSVLISGARKRGNAELERICSELALAIGSNNPLATLVGRKSQLEALIFDYRRQDESQQRWA